MTDSEWSLDASQGELLVHTDVSGRAAKMGHRLTIAMTCWQAAVSWSGDRPTAVQLTVDVESLRVLRGEGGLTPLSPPEKALVRSSALSCLGSDRYPRITFRSSEIAIMSDSYRLIGALEIYGRARRHDVDVQVTDLGDTWRMRSDTELRQSDYGVKRYSMLMGSMKVADAVRVSFSATHAKAD